jgi:copper chaperone NosL
MTIADSGYGSEMVTAKGKVYRFDSIECLAAFSITGGIAAENIHSMWVTDFNLPKTFLRADKATIIASERQKSPMGVGLIAVKSPEQAARLIEGVGGKVLPWEQVRTLVKTEWQL